MPADTNLLLDQVSKKTPTECGGLTRITDFFPGKFVNLQKGSSSTKQLESGVLYRAKILKTGLL